MPVYSTYPAYPYDFYDAYAAPVCLEGYAPDTDLFDGHFDAAFSNRQLAGMTWFALSVFSAPLSAGLSLLALLVFPADYALDKASRAQNKKKYASSEREAALAFVQKLSGFQLRYFSSMVLEKYHASKSLGDLPRQSDASSKLYKLMQDAATDDSRLKGELKSYLEDTDRNDGKAMMVALVRTANDHQVNLQSATTEEPSLLPIYSGPRAEVDSTWQLICKSYAAPSFKTADPDELVAFYGAGYVAPIVAGLYAGIAMTDPVVGLVVAGALYGFSYAYWGLYRSGTLAQNLTRNSNKAQYEMQEAHLIATKLAKLDAPRLDCFLMNMQRHYRANAKASFFAQSSETSVFFQLIDEFSTPDVKCMILQQYLRNDSNDGSALHYAMVKAWREMAPVSENAVTIEEGVQSTELSPLLTR